MALSIGIVGLPNVGKSTLFTAMTNKGGLAANYPFATIEPNVGIVPVPDDRLQALAEIDHPAKIVPATVEFVDIAGLVAGASQGEGLGNQFLANIRETDAIAEVVRFFGDPDVTHVAGKVDPRSDVDTIKTELILADIATVEKAIPRLEKEAKRDKSGAAKLEAACDARAGRIEDEGLRVVLCGRPNAGKSSLLNALLGGERAIVTDIPGTTRDTLTEAVQIGGVRVLLTDTAGLRETGDAVERIGVERAKKALAEADVRALVLDSASPLTEEDKAALFGLAPQMIVLSKGDLAQRLTAADVRAAFGDVPMVTVCATRGEGMEALRDALTAFVPADGAESSALSQARHVEAAGRARAALCDAVTAIEDGMPLDVAAVDLSAALDALGEITGETMSERVIDEVFAKFCVGK